MEDRVTPTAGQLDPSFGVGGLVTTRFSGPSADAGRAIAIDSLGRILVAGSTNNGANEDFAICRYTPAGALDTSFGGNGIVTIDFAISDDYADSVAIDSMNRVVVAGYTYYGSNSIFAVARLTTAGALDTSFDADGKQTITFGTTDEKANGVAVDSMDRVIVVGYADNFPFGNSDFAVARLYVSGALDTGFDTDGKKTYSFGAFDDVATSVALDSFGRIVVAGYANTGSSGDDFAVARLTDAGAFDASFNFGAGQLVGIGASNDQALSVAIDSMNRVVIAGNAIVGSYSDFAVARLTEFGALDDSFNFFGIQIVDFGTTAYDTANGVAVDSMARVIVAGYTRNGSNYDIAVARLTTAGELDNSFDFDGKLTLTLGTSHDSASGMVIDSMGRLVVGGTSGIGSTFDFAVARLAETGALDSSFDGDGKLTTDLNAVANGFAYAVAVDGLGRTVIAGYTSNGSNNDFAVSRFSVDGTLDMSFGGTGRVTIDFAASQDRAYGVAVDSLDRVVVAGQSLTGSKYYFAVARLTPAGLLDADFDGDGKIIFGFTGTTIFARAVAIDSMDRVIVAGSSNGDFAVARLTTTGTFDSDFDTDGKKTIDFGTSNDVAYGVAVDSMDRVVVAGYTKPLGNNFEFAVARLTATGLLDSSFDTDGKQTTTAGGIAYGVTVDSQDRVVVIGTAQGISSGDFFVVRYTVVGALDSTFDTDGKQTISFGPSQDTAYSVTVDSLNRVTIAGETSNGANINFAVARLTEPGALDASFDADGKQTIDFGSTRDKAYGVAIDSFDRLVVGGISDSHGYLFAVARLTGDTSPSKLASITVNDGSPHRSMVTSLKVTFDSKVSFTGSPASAFQLNRQSDNAPVTLSAVVDVSGTFVTLTFTGGAIELAGSLADGRFTLKILASQFGGLGFDGNGNGLANLSPADDYIQVGSPTSANKLFRLFGDSDGDGAVAANDFIQFRLVFGLSSVTFDFDGDGSVSANDFIQFRLRFGGSI